MSAPPATPGRRLLAWAIDTEGSTRSAALIRIGLAALLWSRFAHDLQLFRDLSPTGVAVALVFFAATTLMFFGAWTRVSTAITAATALALVYGGEHLSPAYWRHHNAFLLAYATALCALTPSGRSYSLDRWWAVRRARREGVPPPPERGNLWGLRLLGVQVSVVYFFSAYDKTNWTFLIGERLELIFRWFYVGSDPVAVPGLALWTALAAISTVALEYALAFGLWVPAARRWLVLLGMTLHGLFYLLVPIQTFSLTMWCLYLAYFDADTIHAGIDTLQEGGNA